MATYNEIADKIHGVYHQLRITLDGVELPDKPDNVVFTNTVNDEGGLEVGTVYCSQVTFTIDNPSKDLKGEELYIEDGVRDTDGTFQYAPVGYFRVDTAVLDRGTVTYTCYDRMAYAFSGNYETALTFPTTDKAIIEEICQKCKVPFTGQLTAHTITEKPTGINKTVLGYMLQLQGKNAFFNTAGTLEIKWYEKSEYTIDDSRIYSDGDASTTGKFTFGFVKNTRTVKKAETKYETQTEYDDDGNESTKQVPYTEESSEEQTYSAGDGLQGVSFQNPFMTQEIVTELYNKLKGFEYTPATFQVVGDFRIRVMTIITATTNNGISYAIPVMNVQHSCDGGVVDLISSYGQSESSNELADTSGLSRSMSRWDADIAYLKTAIVNVLSAERAKILYAEISSLNATNATIKKLDASTVKIDNLTAEVAKLGYVTATEIEANYARLDKANIPTAWIDTAMIGAGVVGTVQIADGSITDAKIVDLTANKITAGTLSVERLIIRGSTSSLVYALNNITGALQAQSVDTINGEILTPRTITADKIVALAITSNEIAANAITTEKLLVGAVTADKISVSDLYTIKATIGGFTIDERSIHIGTPDKIYFVEDFEIMSADDMQNLTAGEIDSIFDIGAVYIGQNMIALAYNWFKADGTFNIGKGAISFDGETISFGDSAQNKVTQICKDTVTTSYVNALKVTAGSVAAENITGTTITGKTITGGTIKGTIIDGATITGSSINVKEKIYSYSGTDYYMAFERNPWGDATRNGVFSGVNVSVDTWNNPALMGLAVEVGTDGSISTSIQATSEISICTGYFTYGSTMNNGFETGNGLMIRESGIEVYGETEFDSKVTATSFVNSSSQRYKTNIEDMTDDRALKLLSMRPVSYDYIDARKGRDQLGLIAEEVDMLESYPVSYDKYNRPDGLDYSRFVPQLIKLCQIQQRQIDALQKQIANMAS